MAWPMRKTFRSSKNFWAALASEAAAPVLRWNFQAIPAPAPRESWKKGLLLGANHIGDILYRSGSLAQLKTGLPDCEWHILAPSPACDVLRGNPAISKVHPFDIPSAKTSPEFQVLKEESFDVAICYDSGTYLRPLKLAVDLRIPNRVAYVHKGFSAWVTHPVSIRYPQPFPAYFRDLVSQLTGAAPSWSLRPQVFPSPEDKLEARSLLESAPIGPARPILACFPTSRQPGSEAATETVAKLLAAVEGLAPELQTILLGAPSEIPALETLKTRHKLRAMIGNPPLRIVPLVSFLELCAGVLCADSGPRHLANAAGNKVFFVRNLASEATETGVYLDSETDLIKNHVSHASLEMRRAILAQLDDIACTETIVSALNH